MAIESMKGREFSAESDVWSFGVVMFELFSLSDVPYSSIIDDDLHKKLLNGYRLEKPDYATPKM